MFHKGSLHRGGGDEVVGAPGFFAGASLNYDGEGPPDNLEIHNYGAGDELDKGLENEDSTQGVVAPQSRQGSHDVRLTLFQRREFQRVLENPVMKVGNL